MNKLKYDNYMHIGVIVKNIEDTLAKMEKIFDLGEYRINEFPPENENDLQLMYMGTKENFSARFCFIKMKDTELELIEPVSGKSVWIDFLNEYGEGIHHLKYEVESLNDTITYFKSIGIECTQYGSAVGPNKGKTWAYFDTYDLLGYVVEVLNNNTNEKVNIK